MGGASESWPSGVLNAVAENICKAERTVKEASGLIGTGFECVSNMADCQLL